MKNINNGECILIVSFLLLAIFHLINRSFDSIFKTRAKMKTQQQKITQTQISKATSVTILLLLCENVCNFNVIKLVEKE